MEREIIVGFTANSSAFWPSFFCRAFRHCAVVADGMLVQVGTDGVRMFRCGPREIGRLERAGWVFLRCMISGERERVRAPQFLTCVGFAKRALGIRNPFIWTPDQLFRYLVGNFSKL